MGEGREIGGRGVVRDTISGIADQNLEIRSHGCDYGIMTGNGISSLKFYYFRRLPRLGSHVFQISIYPPYSPFHSPFTFFLISILQNFLIDLFFFFVFFIDNFFHRQSRILTSRRFEAKEEVEKRKQTQRLREREREGRLCLRRTAASPYLRLVSSNGYFNRS